MGKNGDDEASPLRQRRQRAVDRPQERRHCLRLFRGQKKHPPRPANHRRSLRQAFERADREEITASRRGTIHRAPVSHPCPERSRGNPAPSAAGGAQCREFTSSSSSKSLHRTLPTSAPRPCSCSVDTRSCPSRALKVSGFSRTLSCKLDTKNCIGASFPPRREPLFTKILAVRPAGVNWLPLPKPHQKR